jgi:putative acetyltransferase
MTFSLRRCQPSDAPQITRLMGEPGVYANLLQTPYPGEELWRKRLEGQATPGNTDLMLVAQADEDGQLLAHAGLHSVSQSLRRRHAAMLGISVLPEQQGRGVGSALMQVLLDYADNWAHLLRVELTVFTDNAKAIALYRRFGFEQEGLMRAYALRDGRYADVLAMARLHPRPPQLPMAVA